MNPRIDKSMDGWTQGDLAVDELLSANEAFCCGTGATITPVGEVALERGGGGAEGEEGSLGAGHRSVTFPHFAGSDAGGNKPKQVAGPVTTRLAAHMAAILAGTVPDKFGWIHDVYSP